MDLIITSKIVQVVGSAPGAGLPPYFAAGRRAQKPGHSPKRAPSFLCAFAAAAECTRERRCAVVIPSPSAVTLFGSAAVSLVCVAAPVPGPWVGDLPGGPNNVHHWPR